MSRLPPPAVAHTAEAGPGEPLGERLRWAVHQAAASLLLLPLLFLRRATYRHEASLEAILLRRRRLAKRAQDLARAIVPPLGWAALGGNGSQAGGDEVELDIGLWSAGNATSMQPLLLKEATVLFVQVICPCYCK